MSYRIIQCKDSVDAKKTLITHSHNRWVKQARCLVTWMFSNMVFVGNHKHRIGNNTTSLTFVGTFDVFVHKNLTR